MTTYNDLIDNYGYEKKFLNDINKPEIIDLLASFLYCKYKDEVIDFLSIDTLKLADFLAAHNKNDEDKIEAYNEMVKILTNALKKVFEDDIDDDLQQSYTEYYNEENCRANEADSKLKENKETGCFIKRIFQDAYKIYHKNRATILKELCHKA